MTRLVVLTGQLASASLWSNVADTETLIKSALENQGFSVAAVRVTTQGYLGVSYYANITLELEVDGAYTAEDARVSAIQTISSIPSTWWDTFLPGQYLFSNISLRVLSDNKPLTTSHDTTLDGLLNDIRSVAAGGLQTGANSVTKLAGNISTPIAIAGVVIVALFLFKK